MNRIVGPTGMPLGNDGKNRSPKMEERLQAAIEAWTKGEKDMAFGIALNAIAYQSHGLAGLAKLVQSLENQVKELTEKVNLLPPPTMPPNANM